MGNEFENNNMPGMMRADMREKNGQLLIEIELPGYSRENINAKLENGRLTIIASRKEELESSDRETHYLMRERMVGEISRTFLVGDGVHEKDVSAQLKDGILSIIIVRSEKAVEGQNIKLIDIQNVIAL